LFQINQQIPDVTKDKLRLSTRIMQTEGNIEPFLEFVSEILQTLSNRDLMRFNEKYVKLVLLTLIHLDNLYVVTSETETYKGYIDILLLKDRRYEKWVTYEWLIELKYLKEQDSDQLDEVKKAAQKQIENYATSPDFANRVNPETLKKATLVFTGKSKYVLTMIN